MCYDRLGILNGGVMTTLDVPVNLSRKFLKIDKEIAEHHAAIAKLNRDKIAHAKNAIFTCGWCKKRVPLERCDFIQEHWYERPHSCNEGGSWNNSEVGLSHIVCPLCHAENYVYTHAEREKILFLLVTQKLDPEAIFAVIWDRFGKNRVPVKRAERHERERALQGR